MSKPTENDLHALVYMGHAMVAALARHDLPEADRALSAFAAASTDLAKQCTAEEVETMDRDAVACVEALKAKIVSPEAREIVNRFKLRAKP